MENYKKQAMSGLMNEPRECVVMDHNGYEEIKLTNNIILEKVPNKQIRIYNIKSRLVNIKIRDICRISQLKNYPSITTNKKMEDLLTAILNIEGIEDIDIGKYDIRITKAKAFDWEKDDIETDIKLLLEAFQDTNLIKESGK